MMAVPIYFKPQNFITMRAKDLMKALTFAIVNKFPMLITGSPGIGKSDIVEQAKDAASAILNCVVELILSHPVTSDPTDYKGLPALIRSKIAGNDDEAHFLPFNDLKRLIDATVPTIFFIDDFGQAPPAVQAACMQLLLARRINGFKVSDSVIFIACTNRQQDKAGVSGLLEPVKSRFASIIELEVNIDDWCEWAITHNMPETLTSFIRWRPELLNAPNPSKDIVNTPNPRTVAYVGKLQNAGCPEELQYEIFKGAAGEAFSAGYTAFLTFYKDLPDFEQIFNTPKKALVPTEPGVLYAITGAIATRITKENVENAFVYLQRLPIEIMICAVKDTILRNKEIAKTKAFIDWASKNTSLIFN
jgi:hypothetical protein